MTGLLVTALAAVITLAARAEPGVRPVADLDLLSRVRVVAVVGASADLNGGLDDARLTAEALTREFSGVGRIDTVSTSKVAGAMAAMQLREPRDLLDFSEPGQAKLRMERVVALSRRLRADTLLIPFWEAQPAVTRAGTPPRQRLHALLVHVDRRETVWEDAELSPITKGESADSAAIRSVARSLARRFGAQMRMARERG